MKKRLFFTIALLLFAVAAFSQTTDQTLSETLASFGISKTLAWAIVSVLGVIVGKFWPQKWTDPLLYIQKILNALVIALDWINEKTNNLSKSQKAVFKPKYAKLLKVLILGLFVSSISIAANAQSLLDPVTPQTIQTVQKTRSRTSDTISVNSNGVMILRLAATAQFAKLNWDNDLEKLVNTASVRTGLGLSYSKYEVLADGSVYNSFGVGLYVLVPLTDAEDNQYFSVMGDFSLPQLSKKLNMTIDVGLGYDFDKTRQFKERLFITIGPKITFN